MKSEVGLPAIIGQVVFPFCHSCRPYIVVEGFIEVHVAPAVDVISLGHESFDAVSHPLGSRWMKTQH